jgi:hypothetical protein
VEYNMDTLEGNHNQVVAVVVTPMGLELVELGKLVDTHTHIPEVASPTDHRHEGGIEETTRGKPDVGLQLELVLPLPAILPLFPPSPSLSTPCPRPHCVTHKTISQENNPGLLPVGHCRVGHYKTQKDK